MALAESASRFELAPTRENFSHIPEVLPLPNLIQTQTESFEWFVSTGLRELLDEITPITDFTGKNLELHFRDFYFEDAQVHRGGVPRARPDLRARRSRWRSTSSSRRPARSRTRRVFMGDFPRMTEQGTFIINGAERVVVSQLVRSPGVYFTAAEDPATGRQLYCRQADPEPRRLARVRDLQQGLLSVKVDRKRKIPVTTLLRAVGLDTAEITEDLRAGRRPTRSTRTSR